MLHNKSGGDLGKFHVLTLALLVLLQLQVVAAQSSNRTTEIELQSDGSAAWVVEVVYPINTPDNEIEPQMTSFQTTMDQKAENAEVLTKRSMEITDFSASGPVEVQESKKVRYTFKWVNFAENDGGDIRMGDAIEAGLLDLPTASDILVVKLPSGYKAYDITPDADQTSTGQLNWYGPRSFSFGRPSLTLRVIPSLWPTLAVAVVISVGLFFGWLFWFKRLFEPMLKTAQKPEVPPAEKLMKSDTDLAIEILRGAGGKMYQTELVRKMDMSKSKVSAVLSAMEQEGRIQRLRTGRKNLVSLKVEEGEQKS